MEDDDQGGRTTGLRTLARSGRIIMVMAGEFFTVLFLENTNKKLSCINAGRGRTEDSAHERRRAEDNGIEVVGKDLAE